MKANLTLHCGATVATIDQIITAPTPAATNSWHPIPHAQLIETVREAFSTNRLTVSGEAHSLTHDGLRYFGLMEVQSEQHHGDDYAMVMGLRNSHDKRFPAGIACGAQVFVCDNLSFSGEVKFARRHTRFINRDLPMLVGRSVGQLMQKWHDQDTRIAAYKGAEISDADAHDIIIRASDLAVIPNQGIPAVLREWREPRHEAFAPRNAWSLFNGFTEALKGNLAMLPRRTEALHGLLDIRVGLAAGGVN